MEQIYIIYEKQDTEYINHICERLRQANISYVLCAKEYQKKNNYDLTMVFVTDKLLKSKFCLCEISKILLKKERIVPVGLSYDQIYRLPPVLSPLSQYQWIIYRKEFDVNKVVKAIQVWSKDSSKKSSGITDKSYFRPSSSYIARPFYEDLIKKALNDVEMKKPVVFLTGKAGIGKTALIKAYAWDNRDDYEEIFYFPFLKISEKSCQNVVELMHHFGYSVDENMIRKFSENILIILDDPESEDDLVKMICQNTGRARVVICSRDLPNCDLEYKTINLDKADKNFIFKVLSKDFEEEILEKPEIMDKVFQLVEDGIISIPLLVQFANYKENNLEMILEYLQKGVTIKYDSYLLGAPEDNSIIRHLSSRLSENGIQVVDDYSALDLMSYMGEQKNLIRFSKKVLIYCSEKAIDDKEWCEILRKKYSQAISEGTEIFLLGGSLRKIEEMTVVQGWGHHRKFTGTESQIIERFIDFEENEKKKTELIEYANKSYMYYNYDRAIYAYTKALEYMSEEYQASEMSQILYRCGLIYEQMGYSSEADEFYEKSNQIAQNGYIPQIGYTNTIKKFQEKNRKAKVKEKIVQLERDAYQELYNKIANYCNASIELFREMVKQNQTPEGLNCIKVSYSRLLSYCKTVGGMEDIIDNCLKELIIVEREFDIKHQKEKDMNQADKLNRSYRTYLGLETIGVENYDAFISYKSQDELLARRVFEFLTSRGKKVFLSCETLKQIGRDEYTDTIYEALDKSNHFLLITSKPDYLQKGWVHDEWDYFLGEIRDGRKDGNLVMIIHDEMKIDKLKFPHQLRHKEIIRMSEFREKVLGYLQ